MAERADPSERRRRFDELYRSHYRAIYAYVYRRLGSATGEAADVAADVFAIAWRRIEDVPAEPEDRLWLYGVARRRVMRQQRSGARRLRLHARLRDHAREATDASHDAADRVREAIAGLRAGDREVLTLVMWEGLSHAEAAEVIGCSVNAVALRLSRARQRLRKALDASPSPSPHPVRDQEVHP
jgi:RNA polymerase sigma factor (sigma-70 family)